MKKLTFRFGEIPQSVNKLYFTKGGRRILSAQGRKFKNAFIAARGGLSARHLLSLEIDLEAPYQLELWFYLPEEKIFNLTYGKDKRVKSPYKDLDTSNLVKLAEDSISELLGLRDRNNFTVIAHKRVAPSPDSAGMVATLHPIDLQERQNGIQ